MELTRASRITEYGASELLGVGLFTVSDAAHLIRISPNKVRRWIGGYRYRRGRFVKAQPPVWELGIPASDHVHTLTFNDLMEVRFVNAFREEGISLQKIRRAISELGRITETEYPLSHKKILTDGITLFTELRDEMGGPLFYDLSGRRNYVLISVIQSVTTKEVEFNQFGEISRWYPDRDRASHVVVNPLVSFGHPVLEGTRIKVHVLAEAFRAEKSVRKVADWYEIEPELVEQAVDFHKRFFA